MMKKSSQNTYRRSGWRQLKKENEQGFEANFAPLRLVMRRSELVGSIIELFISALAGVSKIGLGVKEKLTEQLDSPPDPEETLRP